MKRFIVFISIFVVVIGAFAVFTNYFMAGSPKKILIAIDSSYSMNNSWTIINDRLKEYKDAKYTKFSLITDKFLIHSWENELKIQKLGNIKPYGPKDISVFLDTIKFHELKDADEIIIVTDEKDTKIFEKDKRYKIINL